MRVNQDYIENNCLQLENPHKELLENYIDALLKSDRHTASQLILHAVDNGTTVKDIYKYVFQLSQYEIGRLWQTNRISVAQEHFSTAVTQLVMSQLYPLIFTSEKKGYRMVATCVGGELHEIGVRMVADYFEMEGWDTHFLGANTPAASIIDTIKTIGADILAVSVSMTFNIGAVKKYIAEVRDFNDAADVKILVGGRPFNIAENLWQSVGADGYAQDAENGILSAMKMLQK